MEAWIQNAVVQWKEEHLDLNPGASIIDIEKAENHIKYKFPDDFKQLYLTINGFVDYEWRSNLFSIWSLDRIVKEFDGLNGDGFISFCDYSICVFCLGFKKDKSGVYRSYLSFQNGENDFVTTTFKEAIGLINSDSELLY
ncbi:SMI1/KNR4 family protein [Mucilaginibacter paludis]|uniref:Cell wall assembly/cell proliferation coordinating protein, KNR4-like protein n=1 Tax=Mucilaginibacter paludis DSM 18603 TaxID=714943 RepID=H1Y981_9SPHI|nr:SMI1/KNR4 family protein [Mucilaginibacter paludis]EHQ29459.1 Cell wall assembly/cell proliferation coordinating protein, KNR4-like protein [Mucilaginibacter paludis DSM 18603]